MKDFNSWNLFQIKLADGCSFFQMNGKQSIKGTRPRRQIFIRDDIQKIIAGYENNGNETEDYKITAEKGDLLFTLAAKGYIDIKVKDWNYEEYNLPFISVIIPVKNRPEDIRDCLNSIFAVKWNSDKLEVIVVDDGSDDETPVVLPPPEMQEPRLPKATFWHLLTATVPLTIPGFWIWRLILWHRESALWVVLWQVTTTQRRWIVMRRQCHLFPWAKDCFTKPTQRVTFMYQPAICWYEKTFTTKLAA